MAKQVFYVYLGYLSGVNKFTAWSLSRRRVSECCTRIDQHEISEEVYLKLKSGDYTPYLTLGRCYARKKSGRRKYMQRKLGVTQEFRKRAKNDLAYCIRLCINKECDNVLRRCDNVSRYVSRAVVEQYKRDCVYSKDLRRWLEDGTATTD